jgi:resuscitation-promoting factor RpfE
VLFKERKLTMKKMLKHFAALFLLGALAFSSLGLGEAIAAPQAPVAVQSVSVAQPTFPYSPAEIRVWWNATHTQKITGSQAFYMAAWFNAFVRAQIASYLRAISIPNESAWDRVASCESGGNWAINTGNGYYGGLQFSLGTWRAYGGYGYPHQNSKADQIRVAERVRTQSGLHHWPVCGRRF